MNKKILNKEKILTLLFVLLIILFNFFILKKLSRIKDEIITKDNTLLDSKSEILKTKEEIRQVKDKIEKQWTQIKNINLSNIGDCEDCIDLGKETKGSFVADIKGNNYIKIDGSGKENATVYFSIKDNSISDNLLKYKTGQNLTPNSSPRFNNLSLNNLNVYKDIFCSNCITLGTETEGNYIESITGNSQINVSSLGENNSKIFLGINRDSIGDDQLTFDTGQNLTPNSSPKFAGLTLTELNQGFLLFSDETGKIIQDSNLYWDSEDKKMGIGKDNPEFTLDINGGLKIGDIPTGSTDNVLVHNDGVVQARSIDSRVWGFSLVDYSGTSASYIPKMLDSNTITNSGIYDLNNNIGIGTENPGAKLDIVPSSSSDIILRTKSLQSTAKLGSEEVSNGDFSVVPDSSWSWGAGWSHDTVNYEADHSAGTEPLEQEINLTAGITYNIEFQIKNNVGGGCIRVKIGEDYLENNEGYTYFCYNQLYRRPFVPTSSGNQTLSIVPSTTPAFQGSVDDITIKAIIGISQPNIVFLDEANSIVAELRGNNNINSLFLGAEAGRYNTTGSLNLGLGNYTLWSNTTGDRNIAIGHNSLYSNTYGYNNIAIGHNALYKNTSGYQNIAFGNYSLFNNISGYYNTAIGDHSLYSNTTGRANVALGREALYSNTTGYDNVAIGDFTLRYNTTANNNTALGKYALYYNQTGSGNTGLGYMALYQNTTGYSNLAVGSSSLRYNTTGFNNVALGQSALFSNTSGSYNVAVGRGALYYGNVSNSVAIGHSAGFGVNNASYQNNVLIGYMAGYSLNTGSNNILIGYKAGDNLTTGSGNIIIGYNIDAPLADGNNRLSIGNLIFATGVDGTGSTISSGNVGIGVIDPVVKLEINGGVRLNTDETRPSCDASLRGTLWFTKGGSGVKDVLEICAKDSSDNYDWRIIY